MRTLQKVLLHITILNIKPHTYIIRYNIFFYKIEGRESVESASWWIKMYKLVVYYWVFIISWCQRFSKVMSVTFFASGIYLHVILFLDCVEWPLFEPLTNWKNKVSSYNLLEALKSSKKIEKKNIYLVHSYFFTKSHDKSYKTM